MMFAGATCLNQWLGFHSCWTSCLEHSGTQTT